MVIQLSITAILAFPFHCSGDHPDLHSFPTRRSSDLWTRRSSARRRRSRQTRSRRRRNTPLAWSTTCAVTCRTPSRDRKSTRLNSSHGYISYAVFCLKKKKKKDTHSLSYIDKGSAHCD